MPISRSPHARWHLFTLAAALLLGGSLHPVLGQKVPHLESGIGRPSDPPTYLVKRAASKRPDNRPKREAGNIAQPPPEARADDKQQAIEEAIELGNQARRGADYERALTQYRMVTEDLNPREARAFYGLGNVYSDLYCNDAAIGAYLKAIEFNKNYPDALIRLGYAYINKERYDEAEEQFQAVLKSRPVSANLGLGYVYSSKGDYQEAIDRIESVFGDKSLEDKDRPTAHFVLGAVYEQQNRRREAITQYEKAISLLRQALASTDPNKPAEREKALGLKHDLAMIYHSLGHAQLTLAYSNQPAYGSVNKLGTDELEAFRVSVKQAVDNLDRAKEHGYNHPNLYIAQGRALALQSNYQEAVKRINSYFARVDELEGQLPPLAKNCNSGFVLLKAEGHWWLGHFYFLQGGFEADGKKKNEFFDQAAEQFKRAISLRQDFDSAYWSLAMIYDKQKKYEEAVVQYQNAIRFGKEKTVKAHVYQELGLAYMLLKRYDEGLRNMQEAIKLDENNPALYESLASIYVSQNNIEETFKLLKKAADLRAKFKLEPAADAGPYFFLGATYTIRFIQKGSEEDFDEAVKWLNQAIRINPKDSMYYQALGTTYEKHSKLDEALANYKKAVEYDPKNTEYYFNMADVYALKRNYDAAIERIRQAIDLKPNYARAYQYLGIMYHRKKDSAEAVKQELKAIEVDPKNLQAYLDLGEIYKSQNNYPEAVKHLKTAIAVAPTDFIPYKELAKIFEEQQKNEDAIQYYEQAISLIDADESWATVLAWTRNIFLGRIERLRGHYDEAIAYFQKLPPPPTATPGQAQYDIGLTHVLSKNKRAALEQYQELVRLKSSFAEELLKKIKEMK